mgnify:CR=1 FL=1
MHGPGPLALPASLPRLVMRRFDSGTGHTHCNH